MMLRRAVRQWILAMAAVLAWAPLHAQAQSDFLRHGLSVQQGGQRGERSDRGDYRDDRRRSRDESQQRQQYDRGGSLTPDERRDLNRDLQRANREFYRKGRER
jgi:hypothetical protein